MLEQAILAEQLQSLLAAEQEATKKYQALAQALREPQAAEQARQLMREKQKHVELAQRLLDIVEEAGW